MLFEKLIEQHRVHLVVAHAVGFSFLVAHYKLVIHFVYFFGNKSELGFTCWINFLLVTERNWTSAKSASLALSIGLISSLKRFEEVSVPSLLFASMKTELPPEAVWPKMLP